ncbi:MAG: SDR family NAD(P)-dependent oxidoreductase [Kineosporiaceae bacterium]
MTAPGPYRVAGGRAVVTGAASGMGEQLSYLLAGGGSDLVLLDRDADRLEVVAGRIRDRRPALDVATVVVDLADRDATDAAARDLAEGRVTLLVNNAGAGLTGRFDQVTLEEYDWLFRINFHAPVTLAHHLLPAIRRHGPGQGGGHVANVSSIYGIVAPPGATAYAASKFAIRGFSDSLRQELIDDRIGVTTVHPGGIATRIAESARRGTGVSQAQDARGKAEARRLLTFPPERAAARILDGIVRRRPRVLIGLTAQVPDLLSRLAPTHYRTLEKPLVAIFSRLP